VRERVNDRPLVALGGGRVIDAAKAIAGADGLRCAAIPTTLSGAEMTPFHRMPADVDEFRPARPALVLAAPGLMASQRMPDLAASAMNALAHAVEALYTPRSNPVARMAALRAAELIAAGLAEDEPDRQSLALGGLLAGYASGLAGFAIHHAVCQTIVRLCGSPHAQTNAIMLPHFVRIMELRAREQIEQLGVALGADDRRGAAAEAVERLVRRAEAGRLSYYGVDADALKEIVKAVSARPELQNTPNPPSEGELLGVLERAL
jgi:alcohol dehydrogenase class IV